MSKGQWKKDRINLRSLFPPVADDERTALVRLADRSGPGAASVWVATGLFPTGRIMLAACGGVEIAKDEDGREQGRFIRARQGSVYRYCRKDGSGFYFVVNTGCIRLVSDSAAVFAVAAMLAELSSGGRERA